jgi:hypothetical protein
VPEAHFSVTFTSSFGCGSQFQLHAPILLPSKNYDISTQSITSKPLFCFPLVLNIWVIFASITYTGVQCVQLEEGEVDMRRGRQFKVCIRG